MNRLLTTAVAAGALALSAAHAFGDLAKPYVWWEAEDYKASNFPPRHAFAPANAEQAAVLSGGKWVGVDGNYGPGKFLEYEVTVPKSGTYQFYARKFWKHGPYRWRFDDQPWQQVGPDVALLDDVSMRLHTGANWTPAGEVELAEGRHTLRVELTEPSGAAAFDAFLLTQAPFVARGKLKPGENLDPKVPGWFGFEPGPDPFGPSPIDLRHLNEKKAGDGGFIQAKGEQFIHSKTGEPVRFWAVNAGPDLWRMDQASTDYLARHLAKNGVNLVRAHGSVGDQNGPHKEAIEKLKYFVAAMKREGIYTGLSVYFPLWIRLSEKDGYGAYKDQHPFALLYFNDRFQETYKSWWRELLTTPNPHTGTPLAQDPAVAMLEIVNEDSYFFWTFQPYKQVPAEQMAVLEKRFGDWLAGRYGSLEKAFATWGGGKVNGDDPAAGRAGIVEPWRIFNQKDQRSQDTARFLTESQAGFYRHALRFMKEELGFQGSVTASNWMTASPEILGPLDKYSNTVADFMDRHGYYGGKHEGERASYALSQGDRYADRAAVRFDPESPGDNPSFGLPINDVVYNGKPSTISEINWAPPNRFRADMPLTAAAYGLLQGTDGFMFFALAGPTWQQSLNKFALQTPAGVGQFPATALLYRKGYVAEAKAVVRAELDLDDLYALKGSPVRAPQNLDELRSKDLPPGTATEIDKVAAIDPLAFYVGKVEVNITPDGGKSSVINLSPFVDRTKKVVRSITDQLTWDYETGLVTVNAPKAQGATGFLKSAGSIPLADLTIRSDMEYGTILVVPLDDQPIASSKKLFVQAFSEETNNGWQAPGSGSRPITNLGGPPILVKNIQGTVTLKRADTTLRTTLLDLNGYPVQTRSDDGAITLNPRTLYYVIER